jgi:hypothetical protein
MPSPGTDTPAARLEPLALASMLTALVLGWCPLGGIAAIVTGALALRRIARRPGERTGRGLAAAGMALATVILLGEAWLLGTLQQQVQESMDAQTVASVEAAMTPLPAEAAEWDARSAPPAEDEQRAFARTSFERLGAVRGVSITHRTASGLTDPVVSVTFNADCERGTAFGHATFSTQPGTLPPRMLLRSIEVEVAGERLRIPAAEGAP